MSKIATILQQRALPVSPENVLFSNVASDASCAQKFNALLKSWQNSGSFPIVESLENVDTQTGMPGAQIATTSGAVETAPTKYLLDKLHQSVEVGKTSCVEQVLQLINGRSKTAIAILIEFKTALTSRSETPVKVDWETGTDSSGKNFVRLNLVAMNDLNKGSGATKLVIGSDGTTYATFTERWNCTPIYISPDDALTKFGSGKSQNRRWSTSTGLRF